GGGGLVGPSEGEDYGPAPGLRGGPAPHLVWQDADAAGDSPPISGVLGPCPHVQNQRWLLPPQKFHQRLWRDARHVVRTTVQKPTEPALSFFFLRLPGDR